MVGRLIMWMILAILSIISILANFRKPSHQHTISFGSLTTMGKVLFFFSIPCFALVIYYQYQDATGGEIAQANVKNLKSEMNYVHVTDRLQRINDKRETLDSVNSSLNKLGLMLTTNNKIISVTYNMYGNLKQRHISPAILKKILSILANKKSSFYSINTGSDKESQNLGTELRAMIKKAGYQVDNIANCLGCIDSHSSLFDTITIQTSQGVRYGIQGYVINIYPASNVN